MNYIAEINRFHELLPQSRMTPSSIALWYGLMHIFNKAGWPEEMEIPLADIESNTKLSRYTIRRERLRLAEYELIAYKRPESFLHGVYQILPLSGRILFKLESELGQAATTLVHSDTTQKTELVQKATTMVQDAPSQTTDTLFKENININNSIENNKRNSGSNSSPNSERSVKTSSKSKKEKSSAQKEKHTGRSKFDLEWWLGSVDEPWQGLLRQWMEYKIQRRERYKTELGARKCLTLLQNLSSGDARVAQMIIDQSIASNYAGLFPLKRGYGQIPTPHGAIPGGSAAARTEAPQYGQRIGQITQPEDEQKRRRLLERFQETVYDPSKKRENKQ